MSYNISDTSDHRIFTRRNLIGKAFKDVLLNQLPQEQQDAFVNTTYIDAIRELFSDENTRAFAQQYDNYREFWYRLASLFAIKAVSTTTRNNIGLYSLDNFRGELIAYSNMLEKTHKEKFAEKILTAVPSDTRISASLPYVETVQLNKWHNEKTITGFIVYSIYTSLYLEKDSNFFVADNYYFLSEHSPNGEFVNLLI